MLSELRIRNIALIQELDMEIHEGFSVLTGETGAGKSIIIEALNFVLGERASRELIATGAQKATVEALFQLKKTDPVLPVLERYEIPVEDGELSLYREMSLSGRNVCRINGAPVSTAILKEAGDQLVDIHGQHAHQSLLDPKLHLTLLDAFGGSKLTGLRKRAGEAYTVMRAAQKKLSASEMNQRDRERRCDLLSYQIREIDNARLTDGEEEELQEQRKLLINAQNIMEALETAGEGLSGETGALTVLSAVQRAMDGIAQLSAEYQDADDRLRDSYYTLEDLAATVRDLRTSFSFDPDSLDQMEWRLETISSLKRKYGDSIKEILEYRDKIGQEYDLLSTSQERREGLQREYDAARSVYDELAKELTVLRKDTADGLKRLLLPNLADLGMPDAAFDVSFQALEGDGVLSSGADSVEFLLSANKGEPVKPLAKVASGGEVSRVMLGFKSVFADSDGIMTMVFDEIDSGISGKVGTAVAVKMAEIAKKHQVLCITHLPQIAAYADTQYLVHKETVGQKTRSTATMLTHQERVGELARIMGSGPDDAVAMEHAKQLIKMAKLQ